MLLDMFELRRIFKCWIVPIQIPDPLVNIRVARPYVPDIAFKVLNIDGIEADDCREESDICFGDVVAEVVRAG